ncbi:CapA family protein [Sinobaca sp. H24]|uniref:CapA family protein n=1 Tax=Sinobaca sp. H24 TaxID=2923376 RepID=UPI00207A6D7E|nr:CapA family protein [Sinobaca sp. H24]
MKYLFSLVGAGLLLTAAGCGSNTADPSDQQVPSIPAEKTANALEAVPKASPLTIAFAGDTMFDWDLRPVLDEQGYDYPFEYVHNEFEKADYSMVNLESTITERETKTDGQLFWIKSRLESLDALKAAHVDMVNLGNNHMMDYGEQGLLDTIDALETKEIAYIGAGRSSEEAYEAEIVEINGSTVAFLSFTRFFPDFSWTAQPGKPGVTNGYDLDHVIETIQAHEKAVDADHLVVNFHWGVEKTSAPAAYQHEYVERIVDETGTDAIVGAHPHWLQGFEFYDGVPIAYSLGNFLFPDYVSGHSAETGVLHLTFTEEETSLAFAPYQIKNNQITPVEGQEKQQMFQYLEDISINAEIDENGYVTES